MMTTLLFCFFVTVAYAPANAQTLSATLIEKDASSLATAARKKGDAVRGAILFSQKKLNCSGCHQPRATDLLGPDLSQVGSDVEDEHFIESILNPSKVIKKGFESVKVLTTDGRLFIGRMIDDLPGEIVLRDTSEYAW